MNGRNQVHKQNKNKFRIQLFTCIFFRHLQQQFVSSFRTAIPILCTKYIPKKYFPHEEVLSEVSIFFGLQNLKYLCYQHEPQWFQSLHRAFRAERYILNNSPRIDWGFAAHNTVSIFPWEISSAISRITLVKLFIKQRYARNRALLCETLPYWHA